MISVVGGWTIGDNDSAKNKVQSFIVALSEAEGLDPGKLVFKWTQAGETETSEHGIRLKGQIHIVRTYLGKKSQALTFTEPEMQKCDHAPAEFLLANKNRIVAALRKLRRNESRYSDQ
jgi:hypothetical protein